MAASQNGYYTQQSPAVQQQQQQMYQSASPSDESMDNRGVRGGVAASNQQPISLNAQQQTTASQQQQQSQSQQQMMTSASNLETSGTSADLITQGSSPRVSSALKQVNGDLNSDSVVGSSTGGPLDASDITRGGGTSYMFSSSGDSSVGQLTKTLHHQLGSGSQSAASLKAGPNGLDAVSADNYPITLSSGKVASAMGSNPMQYQAGVAQQYPSSSSPDKSLFASRHLLMNGGLSADSLGLRATRHNSELNPYAASSPMSNLALPGGDESQHLLAMQQASLSTSQQQRQLQQQQAQQQQPQWLTNAVTAQASQQSPTLSGGTGKSTLLDHFSRFWSMVGGRGGRSLLPSIASPFSKSSLATSASSTNQQSLISPIGLASRQTFALPSNEQQVAAQIAAPAQSSATIQSIESQQQQAHQQPAQQQQH